MAAITLPVGRIVNLTGQITVLNRVGGYPQEGDIAWLSSNPAIAAFQEFTPPQGFANNGQTTGPAATLQGIAPGNCVVTATINGQTATLNVTVAQPPDANVTGVAIGLSS
jgi:hypothetical protein